MKPGIYTMPAEDYHSDPAAQPSLSASIASILYAKSPRHAAAAHPRLNPDYAPREDARFDVGRVAHALLLENRPLDEAVVVIDAKDWKTNAAKDARDEARAIGKTPLLAHTVDSVIAMLEATRSQLEAVNAEPALFADGKPEQTLIWQEDGVTCRALVDWLHDDYSALDDLKTTSASANPDRWTRTLFTIGADIQAAWYLRGLRALTNIEADFRFVVAETYPPYALSVVSLGPDVLEVANAKIELALALWRVCLQTGKWPGYSTEIAHTELPPWEEARFLEKRALEDVAA